MKTFNFMKFIFPFLLVTFAWATSFAQLNLPSPSPDNEYKQQVGFTDVIVKYSRPSARGRVVFGELVPFGELWRTGAHDATTIQFSDSVSLNDHDIPPGTYTLFTIPLRQEWTIILNKATEMHGTADYDRALDLVRFPAKASKSTRYYETFTIEINDIGKDEANLFLLWENTQVVITIKNNADKRVMAEINERINIKKEDRASLYYQSSLYYFNNQKDLQQAYTWIQVATTKAQDAAYWQLQAKIEAAQNDYARALTSLGKSTELAKAKKLEPIVVANEKLHNEWSSRKK